MEYYKRESVFHPCYCQKEDPSDPDQCLGHFNSGAVWIKWIITRSKDFLDLTNISCIAGHHPQAELLENWPFYNKYRIKEVTDERTREQLNRGIIKTKIWVF